jgi:hypothetical protein
MTGAGTVDPGSPWSRVLDQVAQMGGQMGGQSFGTWMNQQNPMQFKMV